MKVITKKIPNSPGVYYFLKNNKKIYIGRAASLKHRISNYFRKQIDLRIKEMVSQATKVSFIKTNNLLEAVILEANLIKKYWPKYNIKEKDNRSFVYLIIQKKEKFPKPFVGREREVLKYLSKSYVFGPYQSYRILKTTLNLMRKIFPFSICKPNQIRPCFDYQIGLCPGVCVGAISSEDYKENIKNLTLFFKGEHKRLLKKLKKENPEKYFALNHVNDVALINNSGIVSSRGIPRSGKNFSQRIEGYDISHFSGSEPVGAMIVFTNGRPDTSQYRLFKIKNNKNSFDDLAMIEEILERRFNHQEWPRPDIILIDGGKNQILRAKKILEEKNIFIPIIGIAKILGHSGRAAIGDKFYFLNTKPSVKKMLLSSRQLFQQVRNEAHRFAISFQRRLRVVK